MVILAWHFRGNLELWQDAHRVRPSWGPQLPESAPRAEGISLLRNPGGETVLYSTFMDGSPENVWPSFRSCVQKTIILSGCFLEIICELRMALFRDVWAFWMLQKLGALTRKHAIMSLPCGMIIKDLVEFLSPLPNRRKMSTAIIIQCQRLSVFTRVNGGHPTHWIFCSPRLPFWHNLIWEQGFSLWNIKARCFM